MSTIFHLAIFFTQVLPKPSLQSLPTFPSSIPHLFFNSLLLYTDIPIVLTKNPFLSCSLSANSVCDKGPMSDEILPGMKLFENGLASLEHGHR